MECQPRVLNIAQLKDDSARCFEMKLCRTLYAAFLLGESLDKEGVRLV